MPQMAPMSWTILMMFFIITFIIIMMMNYFLIQPSASTDEINTQKEKNSINWKW
uniref:ATP synthase F0 subunit 8 n=1 Tax=Duolandrevus obsidianus TaxID=2715842 RepID=UPI0030DEACC6